MVALIVTMAWHSHQLNKIVTGLQRQVCYIFTIRIVPLAERVHQAPYSIAGKSRTNVQLFYDDIPSNTITLSVVDAAPGIFTSLEGSDAIV